MNILNIHGYKGDKINTNFRILTEAGYIVTSLTIDYDSHDPDEIIDFLSNIVKERDIKLIVAASFGAFFGKILSVNLNIPLIATNPCLKPSESLKPIAPEYFADKAKANWISNKEAELFAKNWVNDIFIVGKDDTVVNPAITRRIAKSATIYEISGSHQMFMFDYHHILIDEVIKIERSL